MYKTELCTRQVCFIMFAYSAAGKLLMMPAMLSYYCGNDLVFPALFAFALQTAAVWAAAYFSSKTDKTLFALAKDAFGGAFSAALQWLFALFFCAAALLPMLEQKLFVQSIFYETIPSLVTFLPFFVFSVYAGSKGVRNSGRVADLAVPVFACCVAALAVMSAGECDLSWLLPVLKTPAPRIFRGVRSSLYNFADGAVMLMFAGRFACKKGDCAKITASYAAAGVGVMLFLALFYGIYSSLAPDRYFAVSQTALFFGPLSLVGRLDLLAVYGVEACMLFALVLYVQLAVACICGALSKEQTLGRNVRPAAAVSSLAINAVLLALVVAFNDAYLVVQEFYGRFLWAAFVAFSFALPLISPLLLKLAGRRAAKGGPA